MLLARLSGEVTPFTGNGRELGYPTANIQIETALADGVYFGYADLAEFHDQPALIFIGVPTTMGDKERRVEAHLLDIPDKNYYGDRLVVYLQHFHRPNQTFDSVIELLDVMRTDEAAGRQWLAKNPLAKPPDVGDT